MKKIIFLFLVIVILLLAYSLFKPIYFGRYAWFYRPHPFLPLDTTRDYKRFYLFKKCEGTNEGCWWIDGVVDWRTGKIKFGLVKKYGYEERK